MATFTQSFKLDYDNGSVTFEFTFTEQSFNTTTRQKTVKVEAYITATANNLNPVDVDIDFPATEDFYAYDEYKRYSFRNTATTTRTRVVNNSYTFPVGKDGFSDTWVYVSKTQWNEIDGGYWEQSYGQYNSIEFTKEQGKPYTLTFNVNGGSGEIPSQTMYYGTAGLLSSIIPTRPKYNFLGWSESSTATTADYSAGGYYTGYSTDTTLYAVWEKIPVNTDILIYTTGILECVEIIEDNNNYGFFSDGTFHCKEFIEGSMEGFLPTHAGFISFREKQ